MKFRIVEKQIATDYGTMTNWTIQRKCLFFWLDWSQNLFSLEEAEADLKGIVKYYQTKKILAKDKIVKEVNI